MDYELFTIVQQNTVNWMYSGQDNRCLDVIANAELTGSSEQRCIRVVLLCEDMCDTVMPFLSNTGRLRGTVPTYGCKYFPINRSKTHIPSEARRTTGDIPKTVGT